jgi:hypothetical protein
MMVVKEYGEAVSQQGIVGNRSLKEFFLHVARQLGPKLKRRVAQQQLKLPGQIIHMPPLAYDDRISSLNASLRGVQDSNFLSLKFDVRQSAAGDAAAAIFSRWRTPGAR